MINQDQMGQEWQELADLINEELAGPIPTPRRHRRQDSVAVVAPQEAALPTVREEDSDSDMETQAIISHMELNSRMRNNLLSVWYHLGDLQYESFLSLLTYLDAWRPPTAWIPPSVPKEEYVQVMDEVEYPDILADLTCRVKDTGAPPSSSLLDSLCYHRHRCTPPSPLRRPLVNLMVGNEKFARVPAKEVSQILTVYSMESNQYIYNERIF